MVIVKKTFSTAWNKSIQPRKQRKYRHNAPLHIRQKLISAHLDKALRKEYKKRSFTLRKGDEIIVMRGEFKGKKAVVSRIDLKKTKLFAEELKRKKASGQEVSVPIEPSNVKIVKLNMDDKMRKKVLLRKTTTKDAGVLKKPKESDKK